jgi:hypothetical protein
VETEYLSVCAKVKCKVCYISDSDVLIVIKRESVTEMQINPIIRTRIRYFRHAYNPTCDNIHEVSFIFGLR